MEYWVCRDKNGSLWLHKNHPISHWNEWISEDGHVYLLSSALFPEVTFENSPRKVKIELL